MRAAVLASGAGTILASLLQSGVEPTIVLFDRDAPGLQRARELGCTPVVVDRRAFGWPDAFERAAFSAALAEELERAGASFVVLAGFMTVLVGAMFERFSGRIVNTHPSLLPSFPGVSAVEQALVAGVRVTGTTVHVVVEAVDAGPILEQEPVRVHEGDTVATLHERIKRVERELYPRVVRALLRQGELEGAWWSDAAVRHAIDEEVRPWRER